MNREPFLSDVWLPQSPVCDRRWISSAVSPGQEPFPRLLSLSIYIDSSTIRWRQDGVCIWLIPVTLAIVYYWDGWVRACQ